MLLTVDAEAEKQAEKRCLDIQELMKQLGIAAENAPDAFRPKKQLLLGHCRKV